MKPDTVATIEHAWGCPEVAEQFGVSVISVQRWARAGRLPTARVPGYRGRYLFDPGVLRPLATHYRAQGILPETGRYRPDTTP